MRHLQDDTVLILDGGVRLAPHDIKFEHECYDVGHLYNLKFCMDTGYFKAPIFIQFVMGVLGGIGADIKISSL